MKRGTILGFVAGVGVTLGLLVIGEMAKEKEERAEKEGKEAYDKNCNGCDSCSCGTEGNGEEHGRDGEDDYCELIDMG